ncbi:DUF2339 domain-containing protein [Sphingobium terrigena]|uniref:DUF2339 domain-containing protein n=1 Tax=Sphingobium terrigena TaxID=2304063 RepID=A0A418YXN5_9SPHN|nr:DUF2339 domain-containing protein [Sphingobium terrigena]RJG57352.1 DUF2339 domain-containing protein [Sphingobium terrigena]
MLVTLVLIVLGVVLFDTRSRMKALESRLALIETDARPAPSAAIWPSRTAALRPVAAAVVRRTPEEPEAPILPIPAVEPRPFEQPEPVVPSPAAVRDSAPVAAPDPILSPETQAASPARPGFAFEDLFGRRLPIWAGGITLAVAGVLLVKYSIDTGLLSPVIRLMLGLLFGGGLIVAAEGALRQEDRLRDPRVRQALAGAGIATLYAVILTAANLYHLIGPATAFVGLAAVTAIAMGLSLRFGAPSALLGLVGGLAAPALAGSNEPNVPLLSCYLALTIGGLCALSRTQRWLWLGIGALIGGAGWGSLLILNGALDLTASLSVGLLILAIGVGFPLLAFSGSKAILLRAASAVVASAQMAALVATGGFAPLHWALFGLLSIAFLWLSGREASLRRLVPVGLAVALLLAGGWPSPPVLVFTFVMAGIIALYGSAALWRLWRPGGSLIEAGQVAAIALGGLAVTALHFYRASPVDDVRFALIALVAATLPMLAMALGWNNPDRRDDSRFVVQAVSAAILLVIADGFGLPGWMMPVTVALVSAALLILSDKAKDRRVEYGGWAFTFVALTALVVGDRGVAEAGRLIGDVSPVTPLSALLRWGMVAAVAAVYAWRARFAEGRVVAQAAAAIVAYGAVAQAVPTSWLAPIAAFSIPMLAFSSHRLSPQRLLPALASMLIIVLLWAAWPLIDWSGHGLLSLLGQPMLASGLPDLSDMLRRLALPAALIGLTLWRGRFATIERWTGGAAASIMGAVAVHILYKQLFDIGSGFDFIHAGLAERTLWEALMLGAGYVLWRIAHYRVAALSLIAAALAHSLLYTMLLHNPLWATQAVGSLPLLTLLIPAFALPFFGLTLAGRIAPDLALRFARTIDAMRMLMTLMFAFAALRQLFEGSLLKGPNLAVGEDIGRSVLAIGLAIGFLLWGIRTGKRDWRIASLLLMLGAVAKVFLLDASGLTGLLRIASFLALGFSLIGIGWLYNRQLKSDAD